MNSSMLVLVVALFLVLSFPAFVIARRRGLRYPGVAFVPILGVWIVLCESIGKSGWYSLLVFVPWAGPLALLLWTAVEVPHRHGRSRWWTLALIIPLLNSVGYWFYALTLPRHAVRVSY